MLMALPRILIGLFFLIAGIMKLTIPGLEGFSGFLGGAFGIEGTFAMIISALVILAEVGGGIVLILGRVVPLKLYKFSALILAIVAFASAIIVHGVAGIWPSTPEMMGSVNTMFKDLIIVSVLLGLAYTKPVCPMSATGDKM